MLEVIARTNGHEWAEWKFKSMTMVCCNNCGIVRRPDDNNNPCKGRVKVAFRERLAGSVVSQARGDK